MSATEKAKRLTLVSIIGILLASAAAKAGAWAWDQAVVAVAAEQALHRTVAGHTVTLTSHDERLTVLEEARPVGQDDAKELIRLLKAEAAARARRR